MPHHVYSHGWPLLWVKTELHCQHSCKTSVWAVGCILIHYYSNYIQTVKKIRRWNVYSAHLMIKKVPVNIRPETSAYSNTDDVRVISTPDAVWILMYFNPNINSSSHGSTYSAQKFLVSLPTEQPPLVGEDSANFCGYRVFRGQRNEFLRPLISVF
jgi:hypothetical protein